MNPVYFITTYIQLHRIMSDLNVEYFNAHFAIKKHRSWKQVDLDIIGRWANHWLVIFNPSITESLLISYMKSIPHSTLLYTKYCNGNPIQEAESHEHLGLTFLMKCHLNDHLDTIIAKASRLNILWKNKYLLNRRSQELLVSWYFSYVRPLLEYADIIWKHIRH